MKRFLLPALCALFACNVAAAPVSPDDAKHAAAAWLATTSIPGGEDVQSIRPANVISYEDDDGTVLFYVVVLEKGGFVVTAADDEISPILSYSTSGDPPDEDPRNPFWALAVRSVLCRLAALDEQGENEVNEEWDALLDVDLSKFDAADPRERVDAIVGPLLTHAAAQILQTDCGNRNYADTYRYKNIAARYSSELAASGWPWGCVTIAMAKILAYHGQRDGDASYGWDTIATSASSQTELDFLDKVAMSLNIQFKLGTDAKQSKSGSGLLVSGNMRLDYTALNGSLASGAFSMPGAASAAKGGFGYKNAKERRESEGFDPEWLDRILRSNLNAGLPVALAGGDHAWVADGYGFVGGTPYFHMDMGWTDANYWWNLSTPVISPNTKYGSYSIDFIDSVAYNIHRTKAFDKLVTGRVTMMGVGVGAQVKMTLPDGKTATQTTDDGLYAFYVSGTVSGTATITASSSAGMNAESSLGALGISGMQLQGVVDTAIKPITVSLALTEESNYCCDIALQSSYPTPTPTPTPTPAVVTMGKSYKVKFLPNGGKGKMSAQKMKYGKSTKLKANKFKRKGYDFLGWAKTKKGSVVYKNKQTVANLTANGGTVKLYAKWGRKVVVQFDPNGGTVKTKSKSAVKGAKLGKLPSPTRKNRGFQGWWTKRSGGKRVTSSTKATRSMTVYARWGEVCLPNGGPYKQKANGILWWFRVSKGKAIVTGCSRKLPKRVRVPSKLGGRPVTGIGGCALSGRTKMKSLTIPNSVTDIGYEAFEHCSGLTTVKMSTNAKSIGNHAFDGCSKLKSIAIPNGVTSIGYCAFYGCSGLGSIAIPDSVTSIGNYAFSGCSGLRSVRIGSGVASIGESAFSRCSGLVSVAIPSNVTSIGDYAFSGCSGLTSVVIPDSVTSMGNWVFEDCSGLMSASIPAHLSGCTWSWWNIPSSCRITVR